MSESEVVPTLMDNPVMTAHAMNRILERQPVHRSGLGLLIASMVTAALMTSGCNSEESADPSAESAILVLTESFRIGDEEAGDNVFFDYVYDLNVDSRGRIYVNDFALAGFHVFTGSGTFIQQVGKEGEGPGEFTQLPNLRVGPRDSIYVLDAGNDRLSVFSPEDYTLAYTVRLAEVSSGRPDDLIAVTSDGLVVEYDHTLARRSGENTHEMLDIKLVGRSGLIVHDSLVQTPARELTLVDDEVLSVIPFPRVFGRESYMAVGSDGLIYYGWNENIGIKAATLSGEVVSDFNIPHKSVPLTSDEKDAEAESYLPEWRGQIRQDMPDSKPAFISMVADDEGQLWFQLSWPKGATETEWIVVDQQTGVVVAQTMLPITADVKAVLGRKAYGTLGESRSVVVIWDIARQ